MEPVAPPAAPPPLKGELTFMKKNEYLKSKQVAQSPDSLLKICAESQLRLPAEIINAVLEHLVNKKMLSPANVDLLLGSGVVDALVLRHTNSTISAESLESIAASGPALKGLVLQNTIKLSDSVLAKIVAGCSNLVHLDLSYNCAITATAVDQAVASLHHLRNFTMQRGRTCVGHLTLRSTSLEELHLPTCEQVRHVTLHCPKLLLLDLQDCNNLLRIEWAEPQPSIMHQVILRSCVRLTPTSLASFLPHCPQVTTLNLYNTADAVQNVWPTCAPRLPLVTELVLSNSRQLTDDDVMHITRHMQNLKLFFLAGSRSAAGHVTLTNACLRHIAANARKLESIALPPFVDDADALEELVRANPGLTTVDFAENKLFQDDAVEAVLTHCKALYALSLNDCRRLTDGAFAVLSDTKPSREGPKRKPDAELQIGSTIQNLGLRNLGLTDSSLALIAARCALLSAIDLHGNLHITDQGVTKLLAKRGSNLKRLTLGKCVMLTDASINAIQQHCKILTHLDLYGITLSTAQSVWQLLQAIPSIEYLNADAAHLAFLQEQITAYNAAHTPRLGVRVGATRSE